MLCFHIFPLHRYLSGAGNHQKKSHKKWQKNLHLNIQVSLRTPTLHFFSKLTCKNFLFRRFRDTALFFFPFLSGLKKPCVRTFPDARLLIFFSMFLCLFLMFSLVLRMARIFWFLQRRLSKKCQRGVPKNISYSNSANPKILLSIFI